MESIVNYRLNPPLPTVQMQGGGDGGLESIDIGGLESIDNYGLTPPLPTVQRPGGVRGNAAGERLQP